MNEKRKYILLVEENPTAVKIGQRLFQQVGCQVDLTKDGDEAIAMAIKNPYDAICMDIALPTLSGVEACKAIRKYETEHYLRPTPIIAVTGNNSPDEIKEYISAGMQAVINKPLTKEKVERFLLFSMWSHFIHWVEV